MMPKENAYLELLKFSLSPKERDVPDCLSYIDWDSLLKFANKQSILGIYANVIVKDNQKFVDSKWMGNKPSRTNLIKWYGLLNIIENRNKLVDQKAIEVTKQYQNGGFETCILKGQGNAAYYPNPLSRLSGDIDIWVIPEIDKDNTDRLKQIVSFIKKTNAPEIMNKYHVEYHDNGISIEAHSVPAKFYISSSDMELQKYFIAKKERNTKNSIFLNNKSGKINVPTADFNLVYQLLHSYKHFLSEGIGLRHVIDYYYLLKKVEWVDDVVYMNMWQANKNEVIAYIKKFGCFKFAGALSYIIHEILGLEKEYMLIEPNRQEGEFLLCEILKSGNFGKFDERVNSIRRRTNHFSRYLSRILFKMRLINHYPQWVLMEPITYAIEFYDSRKYRKMLAKWMKE